jgi:DNA-binding NtrC family response regulator
LFPYFAFAASLLRTLGIGSRQTAGRFVVKTEHMESLLLVEDKNELRAMLRKALERAGYTVDEAPDGAAAIHKIRARRYLLVLTDLKLPGASGLEVLRASKNADATIPVILLTAFGSVEEAVTAMKEGAFDFLQKPVDLDHLKLLVQRAAKQQEMLRENILLREEYAARYGFPRIVGEHTSIREVSQQIQRVAATDSTALLLGESGTGKELFARAIHHLSPRREQPFVALNCAAIPEGLVENELFGHEKGAFTGASERRIGLFEEAQGGTLFLDEIGEIDATIQVKLLRFLGERTFQRVGSNKTQTADVRLITATNKRLEDMVKAGTFREDLYYRLCVVEICLPPLRERTSDIPLLAQSFLREFSREMGKDVKDFTAEALEALIHYSWPGNVRELRSALERAVVLCRGDRITVRDLPAAMRGGPGAAATPQRLLAQNDLTVKEAEKQLIMRALKEANGNRTRAAARIGMSRRTLHRKLHSHHLEGL